MPDDAGYKVVSPDEWRRSFAEKRASASPATAGYRKVSPEEWSTSFKAKRGGSTAEGGPVSAGAPSIEKPEGWAPWLVKRGVETVGGTLGGVSGAALGAIPAIGEAASIVGIPAAAATEYGATQAGVAAGLTGADLVNAELDKYLYGRNIDASKRTLLKDYLTNLVGAVGGDQVIRWLPSIVGKVLGTTAAQESLQGATEFAGGAQREYLEKSGEKTATGMGQAVTAQQQEVKAAEPAGRQEIIKGETGATPETAATRTVPPTVTHEGVTSPTPEALAKQAGPKGLFLKVKERVGDAYGAQYEKLLGHYKQNKVDNVVPIRNVLGKWEQIFTSQGTEASPGLKALLQDAQDISPKSFLDVAAARARGPLAPKAEAKLLEMGEVRGAGPTVDRLMAFKRKAVNFELHSANDTEASIAGELAEAADKTLEGSGGLPEDVRKNLGVLNSKYWDYKHTFNRQITKAVANAQGLAGADEIFSNPRLTQYIANNANAAEKAEMHDTFGQWAATADPTKVLAKTPEEAEAKARAYALVAPNSAFANPKSLMYVSGELKNLPPEAYAQAQAGWTQTWKEIQLQGAKDVRDVGVQRLKTLSQVGQRVLKQVQNAKTPQEQAEIVDKFFRGMTPESFGQQVGQAQKLSPGPLATEGIGPRDDKGRAGSWMMHMMQRPGAAKWYLATAALTGAMYGHPSAFWTMLGIGATGFEARRMMQAATIKALTSPTWQPVMSSLANKAYGVMGSSVARAVASDAVAQAAKRYEGVTVEQPKGTNPVVKGAESKRVENIAGPHADATRIGDVKTVSEKIAKPGKPADVDLALKTGRVSIAQVRDMLDAGGHDLSSVFKGLSMQDSIDTLAKASPQEREMFLPVIAQKIQDEAKGKSPQEQQFLVAQLKAVMGEQGAQA